jgi:bifunctional DNA-binding transcriptional regulator/antitoxin component of YhaV-PrlF toxin-antitoxin module
LECLGKANKVLEVWFVRGRLRFDVPLTEAVSFKTVLQRENRVQVPRQIRWHYKLEPTQVLKVTVDAIGFFNVIESFYATMRNDGRITIPKLTLNLLQSKTYDKKSLTGKVLEVRLAPA